MSVPNIRIRKMWLEKKREIGEITDLKQAHVEIRTQLSMALMTQLRRIGFSANISEKAANVFSSIVDRVVMEILKEIKRGAKT